MSLLHVLQKRKKILSGLLVFCGEYKYAKDKADFIQKALPNKMKTLSLPFLPPSAPMSRYSYSRNAACVMGLLLDIRLLVPECLQDRGCHQSVRR